MNIQSIKDEYMAWIALDSAVWLGKEENVKTCTAIGSFVCGLKAD